jgi:cell wall-associated NlpC family hydrolase
MHRKIKTEYILNLLFIALMAILIPDIYSQTGYSNHKNTGVITVVKDTIPPSDTIKSRDYNEAVIDSVIDFGKKFLGLRYKYRGTTPQGFDCSGYVSYIFSKFGYSFPHSSAAMAMIGKKVDIKSARKGDFIYFKGRSTKSGRVGHVALIIEADSGEVTMMHSTCMQGVIIEKYNNSDYYKRRYLMCRRYQF